MSDTDHPTITAWLADLNRQSKSQSTLDNYRRALAHFSRWSEQTYGQPFDPAAIIPRDVADWRAYQQTVEKVKPATINLRLAGLSRFFKWTVARGQARSDPTAEIVGLRLEARRPSSLDDVFVRRLLRQVHQGGSKRDAALVELLLGAGLRVSEVLDLSVGDVTIRQRSLFEINCVQYKKKPQQISQQSC